MKKVEATGSNGSVLKPNGLMVNGLPHVRIPVMGSLVVEWLIPRLSKTNACITRVIRGSEEWDSEYKIRVVVEKNIQYFKEPMACGNLKTRNNLTIKADLLLAGITQLTTVILADKINQPKYLRSLKPLIA